MQFENNEKIQELIQNKEYMEHLLSLGSAEEMSKELEKEDIDLSPEDLRKIYELAKKREAGELSDEELEEVAGGSVLYAVAFGLIFATIAGAGAGLGVAMCKKNSKR